MNPISHSPSRKRKSHLRQATFRNGRKSDFASVLKRRADAYFRKERLSKNANLLMVVKTLFYFGGWFGLYALVMSGRFDAPAMLAMAMGIGFFSAQIGFNVGHDAIHGSYSSDSRVNKWVSTAFEFMGANSYTWKIRHNLLHHTCTNVIGADGDLESMPLLRFCVKPGRKWFHSYQHLYAPFLYCFTSLVWVFKKDYKHIFEERHDLRLKNPPPLRVYVSLFGFKILYYFAFLIAPLFVLGIPFWQVFIGFLAMHSVMGLTLASVFQLGHCVEGPEFLNFPEGGQITDSWAEHQLKSSSNFGGGFLKTWLCGGLNYQIEHHLFANVCHVHYPALSKIVRRTAEEFGLPYHEQPGFFAAVRSHYKTLKFFGNSDPVSVA